ncbi:hypothetical protein V5O48_001505 [Marasmius crinis-equi]|uniref:RRM domain-containing protein n=1 Tax=Marasmius crinis-equi TaxID=585013 RepID=A0ABR3FY88_9AGAR
MAMMSPTHMMHRSGSPSDNAPHNLLHHIQSQDPSYTHRPLQNGLYSMNGSHNAGHITAEFSERMGEQQKAKLNGLNNPVQRQSFTAIPNATRSSRHTNTSVPALPSTNHSLYRDTSTNTAPQPYFSPNEIYPPHLTSPTQAQLQPFDPRSSFDFAGPGPASNGGNHPKTSYPVDYISNNPPSAFTLGSGKPLQGQPPVSQPQLNGYIGRNNTFPNALQLSSQTPYGPHIATGMPTGNGGSAGNSSAVPGPNGVTQEEISTIFVVGFPDDMQEREFQNMFTFSTGFEAATLKIPNKEFSSYGGLPGTAPGASNIRSGSVSGSGSFGFQGPNDPYNLVTVNQGGVVVDGGRDGTMASWPAPQVDENAAGNNHFFGGVGGANGPPRKQIIGFAKFRTRDEAIIARDMLQGRRVDIEKGAVLKAEMAKKNLHTKRGVGPVVPGGMATAGGGGLGPSAVNGALPPAQNHPMTTGVAPNMPVLQQQQFVADAYGNEVLNPRDREMATVNAMGLANNLAPGGRASHWQHQEPQALPPGLTRDREDEERKRDIYGAMGLSSSAKPDEMDREGKKKDALRLRSGSAYDAFHSVPPSQQGPQRQGQGAMIGNGYNPNFNSVLGQQQSVEHIDINNAPGPWDSLRHEASRSTAIVSSSSSGRSSPSAVTVNSALPGAPLRRASPPGDEQAQPHYLNEQNGRAPSESSVTGHSHSGASSSSRNGSDSENEIAVVMGELVVTTENGTTSPQLPSPASGASASSGSTRNRIDQNPPINTLYVGNLPTTPPPMGSDILEDSLRELFRARPGFRRLSFKQKSSGPMCFVEFEDVNAASKTITELSGNTLNGLVRGGGIRLSYSRNPLGVRTPTSASAPGPVLQQQQQSPPGSLFAPTGSFAGQPQPGSNQNHHAYMMSPPPPRFANTPSAPYGAAAAFAGVPGPFYGGNNGGANANFSGYRLPSSNESSPPLGNNFSPFEVGNAAHSSIPDLGSDLRNLEQLPQDHHHPRTLSPQHTT